MCSHVISSVHATGPILAVVVAICSAFFFSERPLFGESLSPLSEYYSSVGLNIPHQIKAAFDDRTRVRERCGRIANDVSAAMTAGARDDYYGIRGEE
jgi:hypothetical protein